MSLLDSTLKLSRHMLARERDPLSHYKFHIDRIRDALRLFVAEDPIDELALIGPNNAGKTLVKAMFTMACLQKRREIDGLPLPQWRGPVHGIQYVRDYPQQLLSVRPAYERALGGWPGKITYDGEYIRAINVMPVGGNENDSSDWSVIHFLSQKNVDSGLGARADIIDFDEPAVMAFLNEARKAAHSGRRSLIVHGFTPLKRRDWAPIREDLGDCPRRSIRRVDRTRAIARWSYSEVPDWVHSADAKARQLEKWRGKLYGDAREHGDYENVEGSCPFDALVLSSMMTAWVRDPAIRHVPAVIESAAGEPKRIDNLPVQVWTPPRRGLAAYMDIDPASGIDDGRHNPLGLHLSDDDTGELLARWNGYVAPYTLGSASAALHRYYDEAACDIEMKDHWGVNVYRGYTENGGGNVCHELRETRPGVWSKEIGFDVKDETRAIWTGCIQQWISAFAAGAPYAPCPSREVFQCLLDMELDENDKPVAGPGIAHAEDFVLLGQKLRRLDRPSREIPEAWTPQQSEEAEIMQRVMHPDGERRTPGRRLMRTRARLR